MAHSTAKDLQLPSLNEQTQQALSEFISSLSAQAQQTVGGAFEKLMQSAVAANARNVGDSAPDFALPNVRGGETRLSELLKQGPVVVSFYRGGWCPFCNLEFKALHDCLPEIKALGATLIGISPEKPDNSLSTVEKHGLQFEVLSDQGNAVARDYGLVMMLYEEMRPLYREWGINVPEANGDESYELPVPATYVIDPKGMIRAAHVDKDYTKRMEPADIVAALRELKS